MSFVLLDSGGLTAASERSPRALALLCELRDAGIWPPIVPTPVLVESLTGDGRRDARTSQFLKTCEVLDRVPERVARRAALLRTRARRGSAVDALIVALAESGGTVLTSDPRDLQALATHASGVHIERV